MKESDLHRIIATSVNKILREDVLGNDWNVNDDDMDVSNNYEPFDDQLDDDEYDDHDSSIVGDNGIDNTVYA